VILASHDLEFVANTADRVMLLGGSGGSSGSVLASGTPDAILSDPALMSRGGLPALASRGTPPHPSGADARAAFQRA
jgi:ABC-type glutathione transport system ATPase component